LDCDRKPVIARFSFAVCRMTDLDKRELLVVVVALLIFLAICVTAVALFFRQWRRERGGARKSQDQERR